MGNQSRGGQKALIYFKAYKMGTGWHNNKFNKMFKVSEAKFRGRPRRVGYQMLKHVHEIGLIRLRDIVAFLNDVPPYTKLKEIEKKRRVWNNGP